MKALAMCALALLGAFAVPSARANDAPSLKLDLTRSQDLTVDAESVPLEQLLNTLGEHLNFTVDFSPLASRSVAVNGKFEGDLDELLSEILRGTNYVARRGPQGVTHLVVIATGNAPSSATPAASGNTPVAIDVKSPSLPAVAQGRSNAADASQGAPQKSAAPINNAGTDGPPGVVSKLLSVQAATMLPADTASPADSNTPASAPAAGTQSLGVMTRVAQANLQALVAGLNAACIGNTCAH
jgi:hypothetical protein